MFSDIDRARLRGLSTKPGETWQGGWRILPISEGDWEHRDAMRIGLWAVRSGQTFRASRPGVPGTTEELLRLFAAFALSDRHHLPARVEMSEAADLEAVRAPLSELGIEVASVPYLPSHDVALRDLVGEAIGDVIWTPGILSGSDVTIDDLRLLADAAVQFHQARPWERLNANEFVRVVEPEAPGRLGYFALTGSDDEPIGISFFESESDYGEYLEDVSARPSRGLGLDFAGLAELPPIDADLWVEHQLPLAGGLFAPCPVFHRAAGAMFQRPNHEQIRFLTALLRGLARVTEEELDRGRFEFTEPELFGEIRFVLDLPFVRDYLENEGAQPRSKQALARILQRFGTTQKFESPEAFRAAIDALFLDKTLDEIPTFAQTPLDEANDIADAAMEESGRVRRLLARRALAKSPDCALAHLALATTAIADSELLASLDACAAATRRALGEQFEQEYKGHLWDVLDTRPFLQATQMAADYARGQGNSEWAASDLRYLLDLDPEDHLEARYDLAEVLLETDQFEELAPLLDQFAGDSEPLFTFARALLLYRSSGASQTATDKLSAAIKQEPATARAIAGWEGSPLPANAGQEPEALEAHEHDDPDLPLALAWRRVPGALEWLRGTLTAVEAKRRKYERGREAKRSPGKKRK
ncbi:MAG: hypothetical protein IT349_14510 [Candidatus Eisenbacteria bacterium]|nr:hypothetical protein [Candidatus Eisenbacteria bacterium]